MPVIIMKVDSVEEHPNADALKVYKLSAPDKQLQIVANLENIYSADDLVYVALGGSILKDGTKIKPTKLRGIHSQGMALGKCDKPDVLPGDDFSPDFCSEEKEKLEKDKIDHISWPDIEGLHNIRKELQKADMLRPITYRTKVKLHGTNAGIRITEDGKVAAQSRSRMITPEKDNCGFAAWVSDRIDYFFKLKFNKDVTIFGEFVGSGVQSSTAVSKIDRRILAVFAIQSFEEGVSVLDVEPESIKQSLVEEHEDVFVLPWYSEPMVLDFTDTEQLREQVEKINEMVSEVEKTDPWVKDVFGIEGIGEGLVFYPMPEENSPYYPKVSRSFYSDFVFKAKGEKHQVVNAKKPVQIDPEFVETIDKFTDMFVTKNRLEQGVSEVCGGEFDMKHMGAFLKWFVGDVQKESKAELEASGLKWKQVNKAVMTRARSWYMAKCKAV